MDIYSSLANLLLGYVLHTNKPASGKAITLICFAHILRTYQLLCRCRVCVSLSSVRKFLETLKRTGVSDFH